MRYIIINRKYYKPIQDLSNTTPMNPQQQVERVNINHVMEKMQSKKDVYNFLTLECEAYLPKIDTVNTYFLK